MKKFLRIFVNPTSVRHFRNVIFNKSRKNLIIYFILLVLFTVEVLVYFSATFWWYSITCDKKSECTRVLLVADPQLIGLQNEPAHFLTPLTIWDSDRYLAKTYSYAFRFAKPDVVIFLGDIFDEGSTGTDEEFKRYLRRLFNIFLRYPYNNVHHIWLPGDNDIGGEASDVITQHKVKRFERAFSQPDILKIRNVKFYKVNRLLSTIPKFSGQNDFSKVKTINVGISHLPLLMSPAVFVDKVMEKLQPHVLFTAHTHNSMIVSTPQEFRKDRLITPVRPDNNQLFEYYLGVYDVYEILVPTCSYRMGTDKIGYGFAVIEGGTLRYTVLWTPSRFPQLIFYGLLLVLGLTYLVCSCCCCRRRCSRKDNTKPNSGLRHIA